MASKATADIFVLTVEGRSRNNDSEVAVYGSSHAGPVQIVSSFKPYFFVSTEGSPEEPLEPSSSGLSYHSLSGIPARQVSFNTQAEAENMRHAFHAERRRTFEADIRL